MASQSRADRLAQLTRAIELKKSASGRRAAIPPRPGDATPPIGDMQQALWVLHRLDPDSAAYNLVSAFRPSKSPDPARLSEALGTVVARHRILRSTFRASGDSAVQVIHDEVAVPVRRVEAEPGRVLEAAAVEARRPFDLQAGPLIRMALIEDSSSADRLLLLVVHHILADERSLARIWQELADVYDARPIGEAPAVQFDDYACWAADHEAPGRREDLEYWRQQLTPPPDELVLPFERSEGNARHGGRLIRAAIPDEVQRRIRGLAATLGTTPFTVHAFAFRILLARYVPDLDVALATPVTTRVHPSVGDMVGYFLNPVVVRASVDERATVELGLRGFARRLREQLSHAAVPFDVLAADLSPARRPDRHPIFQAMFVFQEQPTPPELGGAPLEAVPLDLGVAKFDLTFFVSESAGSAEVSVEFRTDRFDDVWMRQLLGHYATLLAGLPADASRPVAELPILTPEERRRLTSGWQGAAPAPPDLPPLPAAILEQASRHPDRPAVVAGGTELSHAELARLALSIASELQRRGIGAGDRVGILLDRSALLIAALLGTQLAGAAYVPLDPAYPEAHIRDVLEDAGVAAVLTSRAQIDRASGEWITLEADGVDAEPPGESDLPALEPDLPAYLLYTSGSTGRPKGVVVTHGNLQASTSARLAVYDQTPDRFLLVPSVAFDSSVAGIYWTLVTGGTLVVPTDEEVRDPRQLARLAADHRVTTLLAVPSLYAHILRLSPKLLGGLHTAIVAGEPCPARLVLDHFEAAASVRLFNEYGPTEATVWATVEELRAGEAPESVAIGRPIPGVSVHVRDTLGRDVPAGVPGEAFIAGPTVAAGYWQRPDLTRERFIVAAGGHKRAYRTGDRLAWSQDGRLFFLGRTDDQIKVRGVRIEPAEIEAALLDQPEVTAAVVVAHVGQAKADATPSEDEPTRLVAFVSAGGRTSGEVLSGVLRERLRKRLPDVMVPTRYVDVDGLPTLPNGKVDRGRLETMPLAPEPVDPSAWVEPSTAREVALVALWEGLLDRTGVGVTDNFFELGGHSLLVVSMVDSIERDHGIVLTPAEVFQHPTVRELADRLDRRRPSRDQPFAHLFPVQPAGRRTPIIFAVPHFFSGMFASRFRGERPVYGLRGVSLREEGNSGRWPTMEALGTELVDEICRRFPDGPCILAGYSFGASMAVEAARQMEARGRQVHRLYLIAPMALDVYRLGPIRFRIGGLRQPVADLTRSEALHLYLRDNDLRTRRPYRQAWLWLAVRPWRRLLCRVGRIRRRFSFPFTPGMQYADVRAERFRLHARYRPEPVMTPTVIFNPVEPDTDAAATWRPAFVGPLTVHDIPDPHVGHGVVDRAGAIILRHMADLEQGC